MQLFPHDAPRRERDGFEFIRLKDRELAEYSIRKKKLVPINCIHKPISDRSNIFQPAKVFQILTLIARLHDGKKIQIGIGIQPFSFKANRAQPDQCQSMSASFQRSANFIKTVQEKLCTHTI